jgi:Starvation-inducible outer membrane lipoprotein
MDTTPGIPIGIPTAILTVGDPPYGLPVLADRAMLKFTRPLLLALLITALFACASAPTFDTTGVDRGLTANVAVAEPQASLGKIVQWGGVIIDSTNLSKETQIEVLAYPLAGDGRPETTANPLGRFLVVKEGYLETLDYAQGRQLTVVGILAEPQPGHVGTSEYLYPVVVPRQMHLWSSERRDLGTGFGFGVGIGIGL